MPKAAEALNEFRIAEALAQWFPGHLRFSNERALWFLFDGCFWRPCSGDVSQQILPFVRERLGAGVTLRALRSAMGMMKMHPAGSAKLTELHRDVMAFSCVITSEPAARVSYKGRQYVAAQAEGDGGAVSLIAFEEDLRLDLLRLCIGDVITAWGEGRPGYQTEIPTFELSRVLHLDGGANWPPEVAVSGER